MVKVPTAPVCPLPTAQRLRTTERWPRKNPARSSAGHQKRNVVSPDLFTLFIRIPYLGPVTFTNWTLDGGSCLLGTTISRQDENFCGVSSTCVHLGEEHP